MTVQQKFVLDRLKNLIQEIEELLKNEQKVLEQREDIFEWFDLDDVRISELAEECNLWNEDCYESVLKLGRLINDDLKYGHTEYQRDY
jgi:hypothetical protein